MHRGGERLLWNGNVRSGRRLLFGRLGIVAGLPAGTREDMQNGKVSKSARARSPPSAVWQSQSAVLNSPDLTFLGSFVAEASVAVLFLPFGALAGDGFGAGAEAEAVFGLAAATGPAEPAPPS